MGGRWICWGPMDGEEQADAWGPVDGETQPNTQNLADLVGADGYRSYVDGLAQANFARMWM